MVILTNTLTNTLTHSQLSPLLKILIGLGYLIAPLTLGAMIVIGWRLVRDHLHDRP